MSKSKANAIEKEKIQSIRWVIEDFLEEDLTESELRSNPEKIKTLGEGLKNNLLSQQSVRIMNESFDLVGPNEVSDWGGPQVEAMFRSDDMSKPQEIQTTPSQNIMQYFQELKPLWESLKSGIQERRFSGKNCHEIETVKVEVDFGFNKVSFSKNIYIKMCFISLIEGVPFSAFRECKGCTRWFVSTHKEKKYCQEKCGGRVRQSDLRKKDPEAYKTRRRESQKRMYRKKVLGK